MDLFDRNGHFSDAALTALIQDAELSELQRLEAAEHLAYCDACLLRYTNLLTDEGLREPSPLCRQRIWRRIRTRAARVFASRYTTAAAAMVIVVAMWSGGVFGGVVTATQQLGRLPERPQDPASVWESWRDWPRRWDDALRRQFSQWGTSFEIFSGRDAAAEMQGGNTR